MFAAKAALGDGVQRNSRASCKPREENRQGDETCSQRAIPKVEPGIRSKVQCPMDNDRIRRQ
jgi:hypothetical protein